MKLSNRDLAQAQLAVKKAVRNHLYDPNVNLIGFGFKVKNGETIDDQFTIRVHVHQKFDQLELGTAVARGLTQPIPDYIDEIETNVIPATYHTQWWSWGNWGKPKIKLPRESRQDPMLGGISISDERHYNFGTLGGMVTDRTNGDRMILSNWHVLVGDWGALPGQRILQPGRGSGGTGADTVARLSRDAMAVNLDAAVAKLTGDRNLINDQFDLGPVHGVGAARLGLEIVKSGCKSEITRGRITQIDSFAKMRYSGLTRVIGNVMVIEPSAGFLRVSDGGDSGSWWLDRTTRQAIGLHFAGSDFPEHALAMEMRFVLDALKVDIVTA